MDVVCRAFNKQSGVQSEARKLCVYHTWFIYSEDFIVNVFLKWKWICFYISLNYWKSCCNVFISYTSAASRGLWGINTIFMLHSVHCWHAPPPPPPPNWLLGTFHLFIHIILILNLSHVQIPPFLTLHFPGPLRMHMASVKPIRQKNKRVSELASHTGRRLWKV